MSYSDEFEASMINFAKHESRDAVYDDPNATFKTIATPVTTQKNNGSIQHPITKQRNEK